MPKITDYKAFIDQPTTEKIKELGARLAGKRILTINTTRAGGGVAEILNSLVPLMTSVGLHVDWQLFSKRPDIFGITKKLHNALQGHGDEITAADRQLYLEASQEFAESFDFSGYDLVVIHDPQPLAVIDFIKAKKQPWIFRLHIDITEPQPQAWDFVSSFIKKYDGMVVSHADFVKEELGLPQHIIAPAIDPFSEKNRRLSEAELKTALARHGVSFDRPIISQVSRFDIWKDFAGVIKVFELVRKKIDAQLVLAGSAASDDPEGRIVYQQVSDLISKNQFRDDIKTIILHDPLFANALQQASAVVMQKSIREGFALTVSEALFKGTPVVASDVGGIKLQVLDGVNGYLNGPKDLEAHASDIMKIIQDRELAARLGMAGRQHVINNFLMPRLLLDWLELFNHYLK